jgi:hypothetical protein
MIRSLAVLASCLLLGGLAGGFALQRAQERQARSVDLLEQQLVDSCAQAPHLRARLGNLPEPVKRYLERALPDPDRRVAVVRLSQHGELRRSVDSRRWMPFEGTQVISPDVTAFMWNAKVEVAPFVHVRVLDSLFAGGGRGEVVLQSAIGVAQDSGTPELTSGALHRFLAEAVWYPWALLPSLHLHWTGIDAHRALATLTAHGTAVSLEFSFSDRGEVTRIYTPGRWGSFDGGYARLAWEGHFSDYQYRDGVLIPLQGEVGWIRDGALQLVWKGAIEAFSATPVPPARAASPPRRDLT